MRQNLHLELPACDRQLWPLDQKLTFLNHGSFGSSPRAVLEFQLELRSRLERQPIQFFVRDLEVLLDEARAALGQLLGAPADSLVFVPNATTGVNTVLRSLDFQPGDELLVTNHEYNACRNALNFVAERSGTRVIIADIPFPLNSADQMIGPVMSRVTNRTRLALLDHVTSQTGLVFPIQRLIRELADRGVDALIDGAHAPGMLPLNLAELGAAYYTGNCHKWLCAPKGAGFLFVRSDRQKSIRPLSISHGANSRRTDRSRFQIEFGWTGTCDPTPFLCVPRAIQFIGSLLPGSWTEVMQRNRELVLAARRKLCETLGIALPCPDEFIGSLASVPIWDAAEVQVSASPLYGDPLQDQLRMEHAIEVPIIPWPAPPKRLIRISAQLYNSLGEYERLANALAEKSPALKNLSAQ